MITAADDPEVSGIVRQVLAGLAGNSYRGGLTTLARSIDLDALTQVQRRRLSIDRPMEVVLAVGCIKGWIVADANGVLVQGYLKSMAAA